MFIDRELLAARAFGSKKQKRSLFKYKISANAGENSLFCIVRQGIDRAGGAGDREAEEREAGSFGSGGGLNE